MMMIIIILYLQVLAVIQVAYLAWALSVYASVNASASAYATSSLTVILLFLSS